MPSDHILWLADQLEEVTIERCLHDTIVELDYKHVLLITSQSLRYQLTRLYLVIVVALFVLDVLF